MPQGVPRSGDATATATGSDLPVVRAPRDVVRHGRLPGTRSLVVCVGDSITHASVSADWVRVAAARLAPLGCELVRAGVNGDLAWNVAARLDPVIACQPDVVVLLVGTNDVNATLSPASAEQYRKSKRLPERPTADWYRSNVALILDRLAMETSARVAILEIPPLGEDLDSVANARVAAYNGILAELAGESGAELLPLWERLVALLPDDHVPPPYTGNRALIIRAALEHMVLRWSWDRISAARGLRLLTDHIHLNDAAGAVVADLVSSFVEGPPVEEPAPAARKGGAKGAAKTPRRRRRR